MSRFGQYLCKRGLLTRDQLQEALEHQAVYGARLGSNLVELRMIGPEQLAECLADYHHAPLPPRAWLERPGKAAIKRVTRQLVERIRFIPLRFIDKVLHVAVLDPNDPGVLDNLRFATGCRVKSYVLPEIWIHDWLFTLFQVPRGIRHIEVDYPPVHEPEQKTPLALDLQAMQAAAQGKQHAEARPAARGKQLPANKQTLLGRHAPAASAGPAPQPAPFSADQPWTPPAVPSFTATAVPAGRTSALSMDEVEPVVPAGGESVRPPPIAVRSLADFASSAGALLAMSGGAGGFELAADPGTSALWAPVPADPRWLSVPQSEPAPEQLEQYPEEYEPQYDPALEHGAQHERDGDQSGADEAPLALPRIVTPPPRVKPNALTPSAFPRAEQAMMAVIDRDQLIELAFSVASCFAAHSALFVVQQGTLQGLRYAARGAPPRPLEGVLVPAGSDSMLAHVALAAKPVRAKPEARAIDQRVRDLVGDPSCAEAALFPVIIKQRVVNVLYASNGAQPLGAIAFAALEALAERMGAAYERLILSRKAG